MTFNKTKNQIDEIFGDETSTNNIFNNKLQEWREFGISNSEEEKEGWTKVRRRSPRVDKSSLETGGSVRDDSRYKCLYSDDSDTSGG